MCLAAHGTSQNRTVASWDSHHSCDVNSMPANCTPRNPNQTHASPNGNTPLLQPTAQSSSPHRDFPLHRPLVVHSPYAALKGEFIDHPPIPSWLIRASYTSEPFQMHFRMEAFDGTVRMPYCLRPRVATTLPKQGICLCCGSLGFNAEFP